MADPAAQITRAYDPSVTSGAHTFMADRLRTLRVVYAGSEALRENATEYLPKYAKESPTKYDLRKKEARLRRNMFRQSVDRITGRIFEVATKLNPVDKATALSSSAAVLNDDADRKGKSFNRCAKIIYKEALKLGLFHVLVDYPKVQAANLAQERAAKARPFLVLIEPEQVLRCYEDEETGAIIHLAWMTHSREYDQVMGQEQLVRRIHERWPGLARTYVDRPSSPPPQVQAPGTGARSTPGSGWVQEGADSVVTIPGNEPNRIMFHTLYAEKEAPMIGRTPLTEVADLTIEHFQIASEYRNALKHNLFPILTMTGIDDKVTGDVVLGPEAILASKNDKAKFAMLEHNGTALESGYKDLESLEQRAEAYAGRLTKPTGDVKATTEAIGSAEVSSFARDMAQELQDVLQAIVDDCGLWFGEEKLGEVEVNMDFAVDLPDTDLTTLTSARTNGDLSRQTYWKELSRRNVLARDFDAEEEEQLIQEQEAEAMTRERDAMEFAASLVPEKPPGGPPA